MGKKKLRLFNFSFAKKSETAPFPSIPLNLGKKRKRKKWGSFKRHFGLF